MKPRLNRVLSIIFLVVAFFGFIDATYLTIEHYLGGTPPCFVTTGCDTVLTSQWSSIAGIQTSLLGALFYLILFFLTIGYISSGKEKLFRWASLFTLFGLATSVFLVGVQVFVIKSLCFYCIISATTSTLLFVIAMVYLYNNRKGAGIPPTSPAQEQ